MENIDDRFAGVILGGALGDVPEKIKDMLSIGKANSERLAGLVNDMLDFEKLQSDVMEFEIKDVDLAEVVIEAVKLNQSYGEQCGVVFVLDNIEKTTIVPADRERIIQVILNLLSNAAKFSPTGAEVNISVKATGECTRVEVSDTGCGIPENFSERIFDRFSQVDSSDKRTFQGTGLGLSISKAIIDRHGGIIEFEARIGGGTTFFFELPTSIS